MDANRHRGRRVWGGLALALVSVAFVAAGCATSGAPPTNGMGPPSRPSVGTEIDNPIDPALLSLPLTDEHGRQVTLGSLAGKTVVLTDFLTTCQETCPMTSANVRDAAQAVQAAGLGDTVIFVEVTVDPARDKPARLAAYQRLYGALPDWDLMTAGDAGTPVLWRGLGVAYQKTAVDEHAPPDWLTGKPLTYDVAHQDIVFVIDSRGHERWIIDGAPAVAGAQGLPTPLRSSLNNQGRSNLAAPPEASWTAPDLDAAISYVTGHHVG